MINQQTILADLIREARERGKVVKGEDLLRFRQRVLDVGGRLGGGEDSR